MVRIFLMVGIVFFALIAGLSHVLAQEQRIVDYASLEINHDPEETYVHENGVMVHGIIDGPCATLLGILQHFENHGLQYFDQSVENQTVMYVFMTENRGHAEFWTRTLPHNFACLTGVYLRDETLVQFTARQGDPN